MYKKSFLYLVIVSTLIFYGCLIKGRVVDENGAGVAGVIVNLSGVVSMTTITDNNGNYQFGTVDNMLTAGSYTVTPSGNPTPASRKVTITTLTLEGFGDIPKSVCEVDFEVSQSMSFEFQVDSFRVFGNVPGYKIDEFDNGILDGWSVDNGTVVESGGAAVISDPGDVEVIIEGGYRITHEHSEIETDNFDIEIGSGDATATSRWIANLIPGDNELYRMGADIDFLDHDSQYLGEEAFIVMVINATSPFSSLFGVPNGLSVVFVRESDDVAREIQATSISSTNVDDLVLLLFFDNDNNQFNAAFSLDGGATFQTPFTPFQISLLGPVAVFDDWDLGGEAFTLSPIDQLE